MSKAKRSTKNRKTRRPAGSGRPSKGVVRAPAVRPTLYHYTCPIHLQSILASGLLTTTESNISLEVEHAGPDVVWLTSTPTAAGNGLVNELFAGGPGDKSLVRITVSPQRATTHWWPQWSRKQGITEFVYGAMEHAAKGSGDDWWVSTAPIPLSQVTRIEVRGVPLNLASLHAAA